ncbi:MAG: alanine racemase [Bacteroidota bacterium]
MKATNVVSEEAMVSHVVYDSRKILSGNGALFFALHGTNRSGETFVFDAYEKGVRWFVIDEKVAVPTLPDAVFIRVIDPLIALQKLANYHRSQFNYPVVAITGSVGKTTFKEWANHILSPDLRIVRSPKSFNSQLGAALSLLEMHAEADVALIEAGISEPGEMARLEKMINPTIGVFTAFGNAHRSNFESAEQHLEEKLLLFRHSVMTLVASSIELSSGQLASVAGIQPPSHKAHQPWLTKGYEPMLGLLKALSTELGITDEQFENRLKTLPQLALRMETFAGINNNTIINDTYNLDTDALREALHYQQRLAGNRKRVVVIGLSDATQALKPTLQTLIDEFNADAIYFLNNDEPIPWDEISDAVVLVKGSRAIQFEKEVSKGRELKHRTVVEIDLSAIRHNVQYFRKHLNPTTNILCMVKASSYGSGAERVASFLQQEGVDYFGVAFADEGVALRKVGITRPIIVMNADIEHANTIIENRLEPAIYSFQQLDAFITALIHLGEHNYPIHLKFDTGMHRLGFAPEEKERLLAAVSAQPEIHVKGIYSHLADADNRTDTSFTEQQIAVFEQLKTYVGTQLQYPFLAHLVNSEGALHFPDAQYDMIRLGIVLYGYTGDPKVQPELQPGIAWKSAVSQVKNIHAGDVVGYGCSFEATSDMQIAVIPVGYADGFRRSLSNGKGCVYIHGNRCEVIGRVCMDMIMVNVTGLHVLENDEVEIIGEHQTMLDFAASMETIPYEVMTGLSQRMHRVYVEG